VSDLTVILQHIESGDSQRPTAAAVVYDELRKLAAQKMSREAPGQTLQATALVHEAWLRLGGDEQPAGKIAPIFFAAAAEAMRRILIDNARRKKATRHGGQAERVALDLDSLELAAGMDDDSCSRCTRRWSVWPRHDAAKADW